MVKMLGENFHVLYSEQFIVFIRVVLEFLGFVVLFLVFVFVFGVAVFVELFLVELVMVQASMVGCLVGLSDMLLWGPSI